MPASSRLHDGNNFDLLRLIFASMVLLSHAFELVDGNRTREPLTRLFGTISFGELGVDLFFILSGYLITASWLGDPRPLPFLQKRILRIYPAFLVAFLVSAWLVGPLGAADTHAYWTGLDLPGLAWEAATLKPPSTPAVFAPWPQPWVNGAMWTIRFEFACYLLVLLLGATSLLRRPWVPVLLWAAALATFVVLRLARNDPGVTGALPGGILLSMARFVPLFAAGAALQATGLAARRPPWAMVLALILLLAGLFVPVTAELAVASAGAYLLVALGLTSRPPRLLRRMPDISYGIYLYGWPIQKTVIGLTNIHAPTAVFLISWLLSLCAGLASWYGVEQAALRFRPVRRLALPLRALGGRPAPHLFGTKNANHTW